jgi:hypothetical protein
MDAEASGHDPKGRLTPEGDPSMERILTSLIDDHPEGDSAASSIWMLDTLRISDVWHELGDEMRSKIIGKLGQLLDPRQKAVRAGGVIQMRRWDQLSSIERSLLSEGLFELLKTTEMSGQLEAALAPNIWAHIDDSVLTGMVRTELDRLEPVERAKLVRKLVWPKTYALLRGPVAAWVVRQIDSGIIDALPLAEQLNLIKNLLGGPLWTALCKRRQQALGATLAHGLLSGEWFDRLPVAQKFDLLTTLLERFEMTRASEVLDGWITDRLNRGVDGFNQEELSGLNQRLRNRPCWQVF